MYSCLYYNLHVAASVTTQGRSLISAASLQFEMFLNNNVRFGSLNQVVTFIDNILMEKRVYDDNIILDHNIDRADCFYKIMVNCGFNYIPSDEDLDIVWEMMCRMKQQDINRLYYKNNLYAFMDNKSMTKAIEYMLQGLSKPYLDPNEVDEEIKVELEEFKDIIKEYVYYSHQIIDRLDMYDNMIRSVAIISDTDSSIISLDGWYNYTLNKVKDIPMRIKRVVVDPIKYYEQDEFGDKEKIKIMEYVDTQYDYDFYNEEVIQMEKTIDPMVIIPQEGLRYSIINILAYCIGDLINDYMINYTKQSNSYSKDRKCLIIMKNEFLFKRVLLMDGKKNYASIQEIQEGNMVDPDNSLDIKGLPMTKSETNITTQERLKKILYEDILKPENVDQVKVLKELAILEKDIFDSLNRGEKTYYKPKRVKSISSYDNPMGIQGIKAALVWNAIKDEEMEMFDFEVRNSMDMVKIDINPKNVEKIQDEGVRSRCIELMKQKVFSTGIEIVGVPRNMEIPSWLVEFINYTKIINDNIKVFPLEPIGVYKINDNNNYTNILKI